MEKTISDQSDVQVENIVVWLDFDTYAYTNFAIISALSKLNKFNFIGIVTTQQDMSFFSKSKSLYAFSFLNSFISLPCLLFR